MRSLFRRYRELIFVAFFLALPFGVFVARRGKAAGLNPFDRLLIWCTAPVEQAIVSVAFAVVDGFSGYVWLRGVHTDNVELRRKLVVEQAEAERAGELAAENSRLRGLLDFADKQAPQKFIAAQVVAVGASPHSHTLRIAKGTDDGVRRGNAVIAPDGIVGTIAQAAGGYSDVQLIVSPLSAVPALSQRTRGRSTVKGTGDVTRCKLEYALRTDDLQEGDLLVTAGGSGFFPKGLRIGRVTNVTKRATGMFSSADVTPSVAFSQLDEVLVVADAPAPGAPAGATAPTPAPAPAAMPAPAPATGAPPAPVGGDVIPASAPGGQP